MKFGFTVGDKNNAYYKRKPLKVLCAKPIWIDEGLWSNPNRPNQMFLIEILDANPTCCSPEYMCMQRKGNILYFICRSSITTTLLCAPAINNENTLQLQCRWCQQQRGGLSLPCETMRLIRTCRWNLLRYLPAKTLRGGSVKIFALKYNSNRRTQRIQTTKRWTEENIATWFPGPNVVHDSLTTKGF